MKKMKNLISMILTSFIMLTSLINVSALETKELESGIYEVENDIYHENEIGMTMSRTYTNPVMKVEKSNEGIFFTVTFTGTEYMERYRIFIDGIEVNAEVVNENNEDKSIEIRFKTNSINPKIQAKIYVDAMGRDVEFDIITKIDTFSLIEKIEEQNVSVDNVESSDIDSNYSEDTSNNRLLTTGAIVIFIIVSLVLLKLKK